MDNKLQGFIKSMQDSATPLSDSAPLSENGELSDASSYYSTGNKTNAEETKK